MKKQKKRKVKKMQPKMYDLNAILSQIPEDTCPLALPDLFPQIAEGEREAFSHNFVLSTLQIQYTDSGLRATTKEEAYTKFITSWDLHKAAHYADYKRIIAAMNDDYSLLYNYDKFITGTDTTTYGSEDEPAETTTVQHGQQIDRTDGAHVEKQAVATYDGDTKDTATITRGHDVGQKDNTTFSGTDTTTTQKGATVRTPDLHEYGNIGVQTTADILMKEQELRSKSMVSAFISNFIHDYCHTVYRRWGGDGTW